MSRWVMIFALASLLAIPGAVRSQAGEALSLKGFHLGQEMAQCPPDTVSDEIGKDGTMMCNLGPTTLANHPATAHAVILAEGKVIGVMVRLPGRGAHASTPVRDALIDKFGEPTSRKAHLNEARWLRGAELLYFDGYNGTVALADMAASKRRAATAAKANKKDL